MTLWFVFALMTAAASFAVLWPLSRGRNAALGGSDVAVYRDQLDELARDRDSGLIGEAEAEAARVEVARRLLAAADAQQPAPQSSLTRTRGAALAALVLLPLGAVSLYLVLGSPLLPGEPLAARLTTPPEQRSVDGMIAQIETHLEKEPEDGRGWEVLAPVYFQLGRYDDALKARRNVLRLLGETADRQSDLGEAMAAAANGIVTAEAKATFDRALALEAEEPKASFYLGLAAEQDGRKAEAEERWRALLSRAPANAPWLGLVRGALARVAPGPNTDDVKAADGLAPEQRAEMVRGMVARLAERLKSDGSDPEGWLRLVRAYMVLGETDKARGAAADARRALTGDSLRQFEEAIKGTGLEG